MQIKTLLAAAAVLPNLAYAAKCRWHQSGSPILRKYYGLADGVDDVPGICGGLWDNLNGQGACHGAIPGGCGGNDGPGTLRWDFTIGSACNSGAIEATWWEATRNRFGAIKCDFGGPI